MGARLIELPTHSDIRGNLTVIEGADLPFEVRRIFYIHDVPWEARRGEHANRECHQMLVAINGGFDVAVDGEAFHLYSLRYGLYVEPMSWLKLGRFTKGAICLVLASRVYDPDDHIRDYEEFLKEKGEQA